MNERDFMETREREKEKQNNAKQHEMKWGKN